jgi:transposase
VPDPIPADTESLRAALAAEQQARREAEARASGAEAMVAHLKLLIAKMKRDRFGASAERGRKLLDQLEMQLEELETAATEDEVAADAASDKTTVRPFTRAKPVRGPLPAHLPRERVVLPSPASCPCCGGKLAKLGETITETLESIPRTYKVIQTVREKFSCRSCETITQPPAPFHPIARGRAGPDLLATIMFAKFGEHQPLNRQSERFALEGIDLSVSTLADWVGACTSALSPLMALIAAHVLAAERLHGDDTTVPVLARGKTITGRLWVYVRDDLPFGGRAPPGAIFHYSPDRGGKHRASILKATRVFFRRMRMPGSTTCTTRDASQVRLSKRRVGRMGDANCSYSLMSRRRRWRSRRYDASTRSSMSSAKSTVWPRNNGAPYDSSGSRRWSHHSSNGCAANAPGSHVTPTWRRP